MLAVIASGKTDLADLCFLVAAILFAVVAVLHGMKHSVEGLLLAAGLACVAVAWLVL
jgi:hypothetical protein